VTVRYTPQARADIEQIYRYLHEGNPSGAENVLRAIYAGAQFIAEHPQKARVRTIEWYA